MARPLPESPLIPLSVLPSSLGSHLLPNEEVLSLSSSVGLYSNSTKLPSHQDGTVYLTSHRIIYIDSAAPRTQSGYLRLEDVKLTEYYAGFLKSSPKVIIGLDIGDREGDAQRRAEVARLQDEIVLSSTVARVDLGNSSSRASTSTRVTAPSMAVVVRWVCAVCGFSNEGAEGGSEACQLCGVRRDPTASTSTISRSQTAISTSSAQALGSSSPRRPPQGAQHPRSLPPVPLPSPEIACPACTFHNHPSMPSCEVCGTSLSTLQVPMLPTAPVQPSKENSLPTTPALSRPATPGQPKGTIGEVTVKLSFRKGGDRAFYDALNKSMRRAAWKRPAASTSAESIPTVTHPSYAGRPPASSLRTQAVVDIDGRRASTPSASGGSSSAIVGIDGLLNAYSHKAALESSDMSTALQDLKGLMAKAKDMVDLAESLNAKLSKREAEHATSSGETLDDPAEEEAATLIRSSLVRLGLPTTAITKEMAKDDEEYHRELAKELAYVLLGGRNLGTARGGLSASSAPVSGLLGTGRVIAKGERPHTMPLKYEVQGQISSLSQSQEVGAQSKKGILTLDEIWCIWNRLRGIALIPPATLLSTLPYLVAGLTEPRIFYTTLPRSGLRVVHLEEFSEPRVRARVLASLSQGPVEQSSTEGITSDDAEQGQGDRALPSDPTPSYGRPITTLELAQAEGISLLLTRELLHLVEMESGAIVRDQGPCHMSGDGLMVMAEGQEASEGGTGGEMIWWANRFEELAC